ncbi:MAG: hypothetical protein IKA32_08545 [Lentisphaeria bacterium]|nr:hypothetical protein [Lentisphaeria bacterium]
MDKKNNNRKFSKDAAKALENCLNAFSLTEFSRSTGVRIELLRRFINRTARDARAETWDKIYPSLKPLLMGPEPRNNPPLRLGSPYRRHAELVEMLSDQKVLLDVFDILNDEQRKDAIKTLESACQGKSVPTTYKSLSVDENKLMGAFLALSPEEQQNQLLALVHSGTEKLRKRRKEMF